MKTIKMKNKDLDKLAELIVDRLNGANGVKAKTKMREEFGSENILTCDHDESISNRVYDMCIRILKFSEKIRIEMNDSYIKLNVPLSDIYNKTSNSTRNPVKEEVLIVHFYKNCGFSLSHNYQSNMNFRDENIFSKLYEGMKAKYQEIMVENINSIIDEVLVSSKLNRDASLDNILD